jgi:hypothetical protein
MRSAWRSQRRRRGRRGEKSIADARFFNALFPRPFSLWAPNSNPRRSARHTWASSGRSLRSSPGGPTRTSGPRPARTLGSKRPSPWRTGSRRWSRTSLRTPWGRAPRGRSTSGARSSPSQSCRSRRAGPRRRRVGRRPGQGRRHRRVEAWDGKDESRDVFGKEEEEEFSLADLGLDLPSAGKDEL